MQSDSHNTTTGMSTLIEKLFKAGAHFGFVHFWKQAGYRYH
jgi:hypothetical protein